jgi:hypothetical protein
MSRTRPPKYRQHKPTGQAVVTIRTPDGRRKDKYLGRWKSPASKAAYARVIGELAVAPTAVANPGEPVTVNEVLVAFLRHAKVYYRRKDGTPTSEFENFVLSMRPQAADDRLDLSANCRLRPGVAGAVSFNLQPHT